MKSEEFSMGEALAKLSGVKLHWAAHAEARSEEPEWSDEPDEDLKVLVQGQMRHLAQVLRTFQFHDDAGAADERVAELIADRVEQYARLERPLGMHLLQTFISLYQHSVVTETDLILGKIQQGIRDGSFNEDLARDVMAELPGLVDAGRKGSVEWAGFGGVNSSVAAVLSLGGGPELVHALMVVEACAWVVERLSEINRLFCMLSLQNLGTLASVEVVRPVVERYSRGLLGAGLIGEQNLKLSVKNTMARLMPGVPYNVTINAKGEDGEKFQMVFENDGF